MKASANLAEFQQPCIRLKAPLSNALMYVPCQLHHDKITVISCHPFLAFSSASFKGDNNRYCGMTVITTTSTCIVIPYFIACTHDQKNRNFAKDHETRKRDFRAPTLTRKIFVVAFNAFPTSHGPRRTFPPFTTNEKTALPSFCSTRVLLSNAGN